jgi:hypothetical protein
MSDRDAISDLWGARTPYGPGEPWPVRVDEHLADGVEPGEVERWARTASLLHSNGDAMDGPTTGSTGAGSTRRTSTVGRPTRRRTG